MDTENHFEPAKVGFLNCSIFKIGGYGTYHLLGTSDCGKNFLLDHQLRIATKQDNIRYRNIAILSTTSGVNKDFANFREYCEDLYFTEKFDYIENIMKKAKYELELSVAEGFNEEEWKKKNRSLIIVNDFVGEKNLSTAFNKLVAFTTKARQFGIDVVCLTQHKAINHPLMYSNSRIICNFEKNESSTKELKKVCFPTADIKEIIRWNMEEYCFTLWAVNVDHKLPDYKFLKKQIIYCYPIKKEENRILFKF